MAATEVCPAGTPERLDAGRSLSAGPGRFIGAISLSVLSAVLLFVMCDGHGSWWPLVFVAFVPMYVACYRLFPRKWSGLAIGIAYFGYWYSLWLYGGSQLGLLFVTAAALIMAVIMGLFGILERPFSERTGYRFFLLQLPVLWVGLEVMLGGNPVTGSQYWIAYRMASVPWLDQPVSILSTPALSLLLMMINAAVALVVLRWVDRRWPQLSEVHVPPRTTWMSAAVTGAILVTWVAASLVINYRVNGELGPSVRVAAVQTGIQIASQGGASGDTLPAGSPERAARDNRIQEHLTRMTKAAAAQGARLVVWPEWILLYDAAGPRGEWVGRLAKQTNTTIVAGYIPQAPDMTSPNMAAAWLPDGHRAQPPYYKIHPVIMEGEAFQTPQQFPSYQTSFGQLGISICFDHDFPNDSIRLDTLVGANIIAVPALDPVDVANLRWQSLTFRAIENRVPLVKADIGWDSAIVNANGAMVERVAIPNGDGAEALLVGQVNLGPRDAPFTQIGGYAFAILITILFCARYVYQFVLRRRASKNQAG